ncbi:SAF domain-containing protein [Bacillus sp. DTU_2020_1000418_1_SI_GHA_SEK_038]|uniref:SAF domain-containing protein n=1 Tax=Bacillus sp. DTU_2020_1000418_1_SI_GHA_SEK_038 TaxID=3077585 RepID=UPI0028E94D73|nr:SAF domain-containing protein [Bacillus sp. DTU_2020_1000418_1_SI_GHA_SEK_038]WNS75990.1 SAF domain-containing protein [Bacillus sp. DTU_2020_1000418_1_SI_GHA_SEK_038]
MIDAKRKAIIFLTISFLLAIVAAGVILVQINQAQQKLGKTVAVATAAKDIKSYHEIKESDIEWIQMPQSSAYSSLITSENEFKDAISVAEVKEGELLTKALVRKKLDIPINDRVVWLNATKIVLIDQDVAEGDLVDIIVSEEVNGSLQTKRQFQNVSVVQVDEQEEGRSRIKISLNVENAERIIHYQNSAVQIRVLRVNQASSGEQDQKKTTEQKASEKQEKASTTPPAAETAEDQKANTNNDAKSEELAKDVAEEKEKPVEQSQQQQSSNDPKSEDKK